MGQDARAVEEQVDRPCAEAVAALIGALQASDAPTRKAAIVALQMFGGAVGYELTFS